MHYFMYLKMVSIRDTESVNVSKNTLGSAKYVLCKGLKLYDAICSLVLRRGFLIRCAILVYVIHQYYSQKILSESKMNFRSCMKVRLLIKWPFLSNILKKCLNSIIHYVFC